jgi:two-component system, sensor histidine kinase LadS
MKVSQCGVIAAVFSLFMTFPSLAYGLDPIVLRDDVDRYPAGSRMLLFEDEGGGVRVQDILSGAHDDAFRPCNRDVTTVSYTRSAIWIKFALRNETAADRLFYFKLDFPLIDDIRVYVLTDQGSITEKKTGRNYPFASREIRNRNFVVPIEIPPGRERVCHVRIESKDTYPLSPTIWKPMAFREWDHWEQYVLGLYYGIILVMVLYNLFIFLSTRDLVYLYYIMTVLVLHGMLQLILNGLAVELFMGHSAWWSRDARGLFHNIGLIFSVLFVKKFLNTREITPRIDIALTLLLIFAVIQIPLVFLIDYYYQVHCDVVAGFIIPPLALSAGVINFMQGNRSARFYLLAWGLLLVAGFIYALKVLAVVPSTIVTENLWQASFALEVILLSFALGDRINIMKREKEQAQEEKLLIQESYGEALERTVRDRTNELEIERNKLQSRSETIEHDIALARKIQEKLIPAANPAGCIAALYLPMDQIGGDFYDFIQTDDPGRIGIFLSDVSGHGVHAAFVTSILKMVILQAGTVKQNPAEFLAHMNDLLHDQIRGSFVSAFYGIIDLKKKTITYSCAGHPLPYLLAGDGVSQLAGTGNTALAIFQNSALLKFNKQYRHNTTELPQGCKLLFYTDGFTESRPVGGGDFFEKTNLPEIFMRHRNSSCGDFIAGLQRELIDFRGGDTFDDDICLICVDVM